MNVEQMVRDAREKIREIDLETALRMISDDAIVLDVREAAEYDAGFLPNAVNIPRGVLEFKVADHPALSQREKPILVYCRTGGRSALATLTLKNLGFSGAVSLAGGFEGWSGQSLPVVKNPAICA